MPTNTNIPSILTRHHTHTRQHTRQRTRQQATMVKRHKVQQPQRQQGRPVLVQQCSLLNANLQRMVAFQLINWQDTSSTRNFFSGTEQKRTYCDEFLISSQQKDYYATILDTLCWPIRIGCHSANRGHVKHTHVHHGARPRSKPCL